MKTVVRQAVLSDLDALAVLFDGYRQFYGKASDVPAARLTLTTGIQNVSAQSLYEVCGWQWDQQFHTYHL